MLQAINQFDNSILWFIRDHLQSAVMDKLMIAISALGNVGIIWIVIGILLAISKKYRKIGLVMLSALLLGALLGEGLLKNLVQRPRPSGFELIVKKPSSYSFPSGHTTAAFASAMILSHYFKKYQIGIYTFAVLIAFSRLYLCVHYPTDVLGGMILGTTAALIVLTVVKNLDKKKNIGLSSNL
ncbi:phosphatase PAP2 family protein [Clostridium cellulovorans]|uniref:Phosphoesterase PA-phosphatase related n=1 Tax=Clostridium cellulovorans (strain ATCC 35296 / DSM 3052 / OCM 3 / 743B) TaxID=573061 RepID=D9SQZ2_CLOC7|nr:phosphatase PAP2 family protein [Clostridium cellulovorans]ADL50280.1 phosphoesterase PA-phosphatase related [Clostridium cellulovorans 743B]